MRDLPLEIIDRIVHFLPGGQDERRKGTPEDGRPRLAPYAAISPQFLEAVQRRVWRSLYVSTCLLDDCAQHLQGRRPGWLRSLTFRFDLPDVETAKLGWYEQPAETVAASEEFGLHMRRLFDILSRLEPKGTHDVHLHLADVAHLEAPDDMSYRGRTRITLPRADELPLLHCVSRLSFAAWRRQPAPNVQLEIAARMPDLTALHLVLHQFGLKDSALLRQDRRSLAEALTTYSEQTRDVAHAGFSMILDSRSFLRHMDPRAYDLLGASLRGWSQRLTSLRVQGVFNASLFWPQASESNDDKSTVKEPEWPGMQSFEVRLERYAPDLQWYFVPPADPAQDPKFQLLLLSRDEPIEIPGPPYSDDSDEEEVFAICNIPHEDTMQPLFASWAKALSRMPSLRTARIVFRVEMLNIQARKVSLQDWAVVYEAPGHQNKDAAWYDKLSPQERACRRLIFHNTRGWRPTQDTLDLLKAVGSSSWPGTEMAVLAVFWDTIVR
ncbi:hypothetical protein PG997_015191 [Apiospora hydei]|uniref:F-box domain-containing protein n=1 Tax=Apiospora hydei TaxID=1337664 RepID=A0ABR1UZ45_9PEZI